MTLYNIHVKQDSVYGLKEGEQSEQEREGERRLPATGSGMEQITREEHTAQNQIARGVTSHG